MSENNNDYITDALKTLNESYTINSGFNITVDDIKKFLRTTNKGIGNNEAKSAYEEYLRLFNNANSSAAANNSQFRTNKTLSDNAKYYKNELISFMKGNEELIKQGWLLNENDAKRKETVETLIKLLGLEQNIYNYQRQGNMLNDRVNGKTNSPTSSNGLSKGQLEQMTLQATDNFYKAFIDSGLAFENETKQNPIDLTAYLHINDEQIDDELEGSLQKINQQISAAEKAYLYATTDEQRSAISNQLKGLNKQKQGITGDDITFKTDNSALDYMQTMGSLMGNLSGVTDNASVAWLQYSANIISGIGAMLPAIASLFGLNAALGISEQAKLTFPMNIIAMAATGAGLAAAIASIPKFADGGIFSGSSFIGDNMIARVNSGEMILNNRQQKNLFSLINGNVYNGSNGKAQVELKIKDKDLKGVVNNYDKIKRRYL